MRSKNRIGVIAFLTIGFLGIITATADAQQSLPTHIPAAQNKQILAPPDKGFYIGQTNVQPDSIKLLEEAIGRPVALANLYPDDLVSGVEEIHEAPLSFDIAKAQKAWKEGYMVTVSAWEPVVGFGFNVDRLLSGAFDSDLKRLSAQFRQFGKPMIFSTATEPNGVLSAHGIGGFGPTGSPQGWEYETKGNMLNQFHPQKIRNPNIKDPYFYEGLGDDTLCDGTERIVAAHRYYYDFFVNRERLDFLTFDTLSWAILGRNPEEEEEDSAVQNCFDFTRIYPLLKDYSHWISLNLYLQFTGDRSDFFGGTWTDTKNLLDYLKKTDPYKPIIFKELGLFGEKIDQKIPFFFEQMIKNYPQVKAFIFWGDAPAEGFVESEDTSIIPIQIKEGRGDQAMRALLQKYPAYFHSCVHFTDGTYNPHCMK